MKIKKFFWCSFGIFLFSALVFVIGVKYVDFAEFYSVTVSAFFRKLLSSITGFFSFSLAELLLFILIPTLIIAFVCMILCAFIKPCVSLKILMVFMGVVFVLASLFVNAFGICYFRNSVEDNMGLTRKQLSREELYNCSVEIKNVLESKLDNIIFNPDYSSWNPYSWDEMSKKIDIGYEKLSENYDFLTDINALSKKIILSPLMTYTHISGIFMPLTGEANVNTNYPEYVVCYTMAHEKAHQRGIAGEDEANFIAFLSLAMSGDSYLEYCAYMSMFDYFLDAMYEHDKEMYAYMIENCDKRVLGEMYAYSVFFDKYRNSSASKVSDNVNDTYIKVMGDNEGVESYGNVVELVCAYNEKKSLP